jgi:peptidoglycan/LPS O-acetylase OafA/YrhL
MEPLAMKSSYLKQHEARFQAIRGLAALTVAMGHAFTVMANGRIEAANFHLRISNAFLSAGEILFQPNTAVIVFYVLSGFVLSESLRRRHHGQPLWREILSFGIRRIFRIVPVMWISILFAAATCLLVRHPPFPGATGWFNGNFSLPISFGDLVLNLLAVETYINGVLWSVQIELAMIPAFPLAVWLAKRTSPLADCLIFVGLCWASLHFWDRLPNVVTYAYCFHLGALIPKLASRRKTAKILGSAACVIMALGLLIPVEVLYASHRLWIAHKLIADALISAEMIGFVLLRPNVRACRLLEHPKLVALGDLSYSFYAYAMTCLIIVGYAALSLAPSGWARTDEGAVALTIVLAICSIGLALLLAAPSYRYVETWGISVGWRWAKRLETDSVSAHGVSNAPADR